LTREREASQHDNQCTITRSDRRLSPAHRCLKLNGIDTIFGLPGIPITDLTRKAQAAGMRVISFRHEQNAGNAAAIAGFMTQKPASA